MVCFEVKKNGTVSLPDNGLLERPSCCETLININGARPRASKAQETLLGPFCHACVNGWIGGKINVQTKEISVALPVK
jgi:hypothetical protein